MYFNFLFNLKFSVSLSSHFIADGQRSEIFQVSNDDMTCF